MEYKCHEHGQPRAYMDTFTRCLISNTDGHTEDEIKEFCIAEYTKIHGSRLKKENELGTPAQYNGHCGFPFGLDPFYRIYPIAPKATNEYMFEVVEPYCD